VLEVRHSPFRGCVALDVCRALFSGCVALPSGGVSSSLQWVCCAQVVSSTHRPSVTKHTGHLLKGPHILKGLQRPTHLLKGTRSPNTRD